MKIARLMKQKNRLAGEVGRLKGMLSGLNVTEDGRAPEYGIEDIWSQFRSRMADLALVKATVAVANGGLMPDAKEVKDTQWYRLFMLAELKGAMAVLGEIPVKDGEYKENSGGFRGEMVTRKYSSVWKQKDIDGRRADLEQLIASIQDDIDEFNATSCPTAADGIKV